VVVAVARVIDHRPGPGCDPSAGRPSHRGPGSVASPPGGPVAAEARPGPTDRRRRFAPGVGGCAYHGRHRHQTTSHRSERGDRLAPGRWRRSRTRSRTGRATDCPPPGERRAAAARPRSSAHQEPCLRPPHEIRRRSCLDRGRRRRRDRSRHRADLRRSAGARGAHARRRSRRRRRTSSSSTRSRRSWSASTRCGRSRGPEPSRGRGTSALRHSRRRPERWTLGIRAAQDDPAHLETSRIPGTD
jgi:hypothetical protein